MAVIVDATTLVSLGGAVMQERLDRLETTARENRIYRALAYQRGPAEVGGAKTYKFPRINASAPAADIPDGEDIPATEITGFANVATMGEISHLATLTNYSVLAQPESSDAIIEDGMGSVFEKIDLRVLGLFTSAVNESDFSGLPFNKANFVNLRRDYKKQKPGNGSYALVLHPDQLGDLELDIMTTPGSSNFDSTGYWNDLFGAETGYRGMYAGFQLFESSNVPEHDANNWRGAMFRIPGPGATQGALGLAVWEGMSFDVRQIPNAKASNMIFSANIGVTIVEQPMIRAVISQKAA